MERASSMENEPRTLNFHQIEFAREAALYVMNTRSVEEAMSVFTEGLEEVRMCRCGATDDTVSEDGKKMKLRDVDDHEWSDCNTCSSSSSNTFLRASSLRDIVTAPF